MNIKIYPDLALVNASWGIVDFPQVILFDCFFVQPNNAFDYDILFLKTDPSFMAIGLWCLTKRKTIVPQFELWSI